MRNHQGQVHVDDDHPYEQRDEGYHGGTDGKSGKRNGEDQQKRGYKSS